MTTMKEITETINQMNQRQLTTWLINEAQKLSIEQQSHLLTSLNTILYPLPSINWKEINEWVKQIEECEIYFELDTEYYDYYDDSYHFLDPFHILDQVNALITTAKSAIFHQQYQIAQKIYQILLTTNYSFCEDGYFENLSLNDYDLFDRSCYDSMMYEYFMLSYEIHSTACFDELYTFIQKYPFSFNLVNTLTPSWNPNFDSMMYIQAWFDYFKDHVDENNYRQCEYLCQFLSNDQHWYHYATLLCAQYPTFVLTAMKQLFSNQQFELCEKLALTSLKKNPIILTTRGQIQSIGAQAAKVLNHTQLYKTMLMEAFYSNSTLQNYVELYLLHLNLDEAYDYATCLPHIYQKDHENWMDEVTLSQISFLHYPLKQLIEQNFFDDMNLSLSNLILSLFDQSNHAYHHLNCKIEENTFIQLKQQVQLDLTYIHPVLEKTYYSIWEKCEDILGNAQRKSYPYIANYCLVFDEIAKQYQMNLSLLDKCKLNYPRNRAFYSDFSQMKF